MVLIHLLCFNEKILGVNLHESKCIIALSVIIAALSGDIFLKNLKLKTTTFTTHHIISYHMHIYIYKSQVST
jgi:hypothetical protein